MYLFKAWKRLLFAYAVTFCIGFAVGYALTHLFNVAPEAVFKASTKRLSYAFPVFQAGMELKIDLSVLLFFWNVLIAMVTLTFLYSGSLFDMEAASHPPRLVRRLFCSKKPMKLLCFLPGCKAIPEEPVRRLYVWLMIPLLGLILLGFESGLSVSTADAVFGSYLAGFLSLLPHGIIEIPAFSLAGAAVFAGHLYLKDNLAETLPAVAFDRFAAFREQLPLKKIVLAVVAGLLLAGVVEGHLTPRILAAVSG